MKIYAGLDDRHARGLSAGFEEFAADQHAADFAGAGADLVQLRIAQQAAGGIVVDVAVAAQRLNRLERHPRRPFGACRMQPAASKRVVCPRSQAAATAYT